MSLGTDAMFQSWDTLQVYAFLPFTMIRLVLNKLRQPKGLLMTLITLLWWQREWFSDPVDLLVRPSSVSVTAEESTSTALFPAVLPEPPRGAAGCVETIQQFARLSGFSRRVGE